MKYRTTFRYPHINASGFSAFNIPPTTPKEQYKTMRPMIRLVYCAVFLCSYSAKMKMRTFRASLTYNNMRGKLNVYTKEYEKKK